MKANIDEETAINILYGLYVRRAHWLNVLPAAAAAAAEQLGTDEDLDDYDSFQEDSNSTKKCTSKLNATTMNKWFLSNLHHPYPSEKQKIEFSMQSDLTLVQINNWFSNARRRRREYREYKKKKEEKNRMKQELVATSAVDTKDREKRKLVPPDHASPVKPDANVNQSQQNKKMKWSDILYDPSVIHETDSS